MAFDQPGCRKPFALLSVRNTMSRRERTTTIYLTLMGTLGKIKVWSASWKYNLEQAQELPTY